MCILYALFGVPARRQTVVPSTPNMNRRRCLAAKGLRHIRCCQNT